MRFDIKKAREPIKRAEREGRTSSDGLWDYLETLGIRRPEATDALLKKIVEEDKENTARLYELMGMLKGLAEASR